MSVHIYIHVHKRAHTLTPTRRIDGRHDLAAAAQGARHGKAQRLVVGRTGCRY